MKTQPRWKSYLMWSSVLSQIIVIVGLVGGWDVIGISSDVFKGVATAVLGILALIGVINNPSDSERL